MAAGRNSLFRWLLPWLLLLAGCARPTGDYFFVSTETARSQQGHYSFTLSLDDTTGTYTIWMAARLVASHLPERQIAFDIRTTSPVGETAIERKTFPIAEEALTRLNKGSGSVVDCEWRWKEAMPIRGAEAGRWQVSVTPTDSLLLDAIYGVGIAYEEDNHGKR